MEKEVWKDVPNYKGLYQVSNLGRVKSVERYVKHWRGGKRRVSEKILKAISNKLGYLHLDLSKKNKRKTYNVHVLVAMTFLNHVPCGHNRVIDHINNCKTDNRVKNLQITTNRHNSSKDKKGGSSKYTGVSWCNTRKKWVARILIKSKQKHLGYFDSEYKAHQAYQKRKNQIL